MKTIIDKLKMAKEVGIRDYEKLKEKTNTNQGEEMIILASRTLRERIIGEIRQEDTDEYIGINKDGWVIYTHDIEYFERRGINIKKSHSYNTDEESIIRILAEYNENEYNCFMDTVDKLCQNIG